MYLTVHDPEESHIKIRHVSCHMSAVQATFRRARRRENDEGWVRFGWV